MERDGLLRTVRRRGSKRSPLADIRRAETGKPAARPVPAAVPDVGFRSPTQPAAPSGPRTGYAICVAHR